MKSNMWHIWEVILRDTRWNTQIGVMLSQTLDLSDFQEKVSRGYGLNSFHLNFISFFYTTMPLCYRTCAPHTYAQKLLFHHILFPCWDFQPPVVPASNLGSCWAVCIICAQPSCQGHSLPVAHSSCLTTIFPLPRMLTIYQEDSKWSRKTITEAGEY